MTAGAWFGLAGCALAVTVVVACNTVLGNHLDHADTTPEAATVEAGAEAAASGPPFCSSLPDPKPAFCDDFDDPGRTKALGAWGAAVAEGGQALLDTTIAQSKPRSFLSVFTATGGERCEFAMLTKQGLTKEGVPGSFHRIHAAYSIYVDAKDDLPFDAVSVQQFSVGDGGDDVVCKSVVYSDLGPPSIWEQLTIPPAGVTTVTHDGVDARKVGVWQRYEVVTDIADGTLTFIVDGNVEVTTKMQQKCPFGLGKATFQLGIYCPQNVTTPHKVRYDDVTFDYE